MRLGFIAAFGFSVASGLGAGLSAPRAFAETIGLPIHTFAQSWTALPTGRFTPTGAPTSFATAKSRVAPLPDATLGSLLGDAFASASDPVERRDIALSEMMSPWDQTTRTAFQQLRVTEEAYAGADPARNDHFVATLTRLVDGSGRSAAIDGAPAADLDQAYARALARAPGDARVAVQDEQERWRTYGDAFAAFAEMKTPGAATGVTAELARQRINDLAETAR